MDGEPVDDPAIIERREQGSLAISELLSERMTGTARKEIFLFVHGFNNTFDEAAYRMAQLWHFLGRAGVPIFYTWPAGHPSLLRGYGFDRESGEYTILHLRQALQFLARSPHVEKIHIVSHSRGTDVVMSALRELNLWYTGRGLDTGEELKLGQLILAAPDLDLEVASTRIAAEHLHRLPDSMTIYLSEDDRAIGLATWFFSSLRRLGQVTLGDISAGRRDVLEEFPSFHFVDVTAETDWLGHGYFISNPAVLSDLILVLRDGRLPGAEHGRPLEPMGGGFWELRDGYPRFDEAYLRAAYPQGEDDRSK